MIVRELDRMNSNIEALRSDNIKTQIEIAKLKARSTFWGGFAGVAVVCISETIKRLFSE